MGCNGWNHPLNCDCGWGGDTGGAYVPRTPERPQSTMHKTFRSFVNSNAACPICGDAVYYYQNEFGSKVWFDELGGDWPKHGCFDEEKNITPTYKQVFANQHPAKIRTTYHRGATSYIVLTLPSNFPHRRELFAISDEASLSKEIYLNSLSVEGIQQKSFSLGLNFEHALLHMFNLDKMEPKNISVSCVVTTKHFDRELERRRWFLTLARRNVSLAASLQISNTLKHVRSLWNDQREALADWLYMHSDWTYQDIAKLCGLHELDINNIANGKTHIPRSAKGLIKEKLIDKDNMNHLKAVVRCLK